MVVENVNTREKVLLITLKLASEQGLGNISLSKIAKKVGIQKASLYSHFASKEEIISQLYEFLRDKADYSAHIRPVNPETPGQQIR